MLILVDILDDRLEAIEADDDRERLRRYLGYRTPREAFQQHLAAPAGPPPNLAPHLSHFA